MSKSSIYLLVFLQECGDDLRVCTVSEVPSGEHHWLEWYLCDGWEPFFGSGCYGDYTSMANWAIVNGIAPDQEFIIRVDRPIDNYDSYTGEYDWEYIEPTVMWREQVSDSIAAERWIDFLTHNPHAFSE